MKKTTLSIILILVAAVIVGIVMRQQDIRTASQSTETQTPTQQLPAGWLSYVHTNPNFTIGYPDNFTVITDYQYTALGPDRDVSGVAFRVPTGWANGTNLSSDSAISVEFPAPSDTCMPRSYLSSAMDETTVTENGMFWHVITGADVGAGNLYEEKLYVTDDCSLMVRYFLHSTNIMNYDPGTVRAFDKDTILKTFDAMRATLVVS